MLPPVSILFLPVKIQLCRTLISKFSTQSPARAIKSIRLDRDLRVAKLRGKSQRQVYVHNYLSNLMKMDPEIEKILEPLRREVKEQGDLVRSLKENNAPEVDVSAAVRILKDKKKALVLKESSLVPEDSFVNKTRLEEVLKRRFFYDLSFSIYGGVSGLFDYGPPGIALKKNILRLWESHFVLEEDLLEIEASQLTLEPVLKASGHVERFADLMVKDMKTGDCYRLDHLIKGHLEKILSAKDCAAEKRAEIERILARLDGLNKDELDEILKKYDMKAPATGNDLSKPVEFNLMFSTSIGPTGLVKSFLRPETAQGIFVNFKRLLEANQGKLPFGVAQIGKSFRNEISPRGGLTRMREFTMGEIEYFVDPEDKSHSKFKMVEDMKVNLYSASNQMSGEPLRQMSLGEAVKQKVIANEVLAYFIARINLFMIKIGIDPSKMRFRQHMGNEMAHYATDCWDCECLTTSGWLECIGCADRSCYDLMQHTKATNVRLTANRQLSAPKQVDVLEFALEKAIVGKAFKGDAKLVIDEIAQSNNATLKSWEQDLASGFFKLSIQDKTFEITKDMVQVKKKTKNVLVEEIVPSVIEPSFGIDRIMYTLLEHNFKLREENELRSYFSFPAVVAPIKCSILTLSNNDEFVPFIDEISAGLKLQGVSSKVDSTRVSIGKRYARTDELGIPYGITIDFDTIKDKTVTLRHCNSTDQIRVDVDAISVLVCDLTTGRMEWDEAKKRWPEFVTQTE